jgi:hypothetical protein
MPLTVSESCRSLAGAAVPPRDPDDDEDEEEDDIDEDDDREPAIIRELAASNLSSVAAALASEAGLLGQGSRRPHPTDWDPLGECRYLTTRNCRRGVDRLDRLTPRTMNGLPRMRHGNVAVRAEQGIVRARRQQLSRQVTENCRDSYCDDCAL